jgi:hypothetical protein
MFSEYMIGQAQECPCDTIKFQHSLSLLLQNNSPGVSAINRDMERIGFPLLPDGLALLQGENDFLAAIRGVEFSLGWFGIPNTRVLVTGGGIYGAGGQDSSGRQNSNSLKYLRIDTKYAISVVKYGGFSIETDVGLGEEIVNLELTNTKNTYTIASLEDVLDSRRTTFSELGLSLDLGVRAAFAFSLTGDPENKVELSVHPVYSLRVLNVIDWGISGLSQPEYSRFMLHLGVGMTSEERLCVVPEPVHADQE